MLQGVKDLTSPGAIKGLNTQYNLLGVQKDQSPNMMNVKVNYDGSFEKRLGSNTQNIVTITGGSASVAGFNPTTSGILTNFVSYWPLDEASDIRYDKYGSYNLQQYNGVFYDSGIKNQAASFIASSSQYLRAINSSPFTNNPNFSFSSWFFLNSTGGTVNRTILSKRGNNTSGGGGGIVPDANDVLVVNCENTGTPTQFLDSSTAQAHKIITANGNAKQLSISSGVTSKTAGFFNGTTDAVQVVDSTDWDFGTGDFNIKFQVLFNSVSGAQRLVSRNNDDGFSVKKEASGGLSLYILGVARVDNISWNPAINTWYEIEAKRVGTTVTCLINSVAGTTGTSSGDIQGTDALYIGAGAGGQYLNGWLKNLTITKASTLVLDLRFDSPASGPLAPAIAFDGTGDSISATSEAIGTGDFSVEAFVKWDVVNGQYIFNRGAQKVALQADTTDLVVYINGSAVMSGNTFTAVAGRTYHVALIRSGGFITVRVNGRDVKGTPVANTTNISDTDAWVFGSGLTGSMREIRVYQGATATGYGSTFTPSQSGFTVDANTKLYLKGSENNGVTTFVDSETTPKTVTTAGDTKIKYTEDYRSCIFKDETGKFPYPVGSAKVDFFTASGNGVGYFDGTGDYLSVPDSDDWDLLATDSLTFETYFRMGTVQTTTFLSRSSNADWSLAYAAGTFTLYLSNVAIATVTATPLANTWYHLAGSKESNASNKTHLFLNGTIGTDGTHNTAITTTNAINIGRDTANTNLLIGLLDNIRISKGVARYTATFNPPDTSGGIGPVSGSFEYSLHVGTDNLVTFEVSSSGLVADGSVKATSFGTVGTATWYNAICWYDSANAQIGVVVNESFPVISAYTAGIIASSSPLTLGAENTSNYMDGRIDETAFWTKTIGSDALAVMYNKGSGNTYTSSVDNSPWASFDFGASAIRWLTCAAGTGVYASSNLGLSWTAIATDRIATYQYFDRSKNVMIMTSNSYDNPLYWAGSQGTYAAIIGTSTPLAKYSVNFQGYLILLNTIDRKRSFNYIDENFQLSSTGWLNFDLPSSADDEITAVFILRRYLYVSTRYKIYRVSFVGGNPDWQYVEVKGWGFVPRTCKRVVITNNQQGQTNTAYSIGEVVIGLTYDRKVRIFDGSGDQILSNNVEKDNGMCEFALDKISYLGSGPLICFAEVDPIPNVYSLCVGIGQDSTQTTHFLNYDGRCQALYPYSNMLFNCMCIAESANRQFLMAFDRQGFCHMMNSGNLDGSATPINDVFESPLMFEKTPSQSSKGHKTDLYFSSTTSGYLYYQDRTDFSNLYKHRRRFVINGSDPKIVHFESVDIPETYNSYQFRIGSSSGTKDPWRLQRYDHFTQGLGIGRNE